MNERLTKLRKVLVEQQLDGIVISQGHNIRYLSGFTSSECLLIITANAAILVTDSRYWEQAANQAPDFRLAKVTETTRATLAGEVAALGIKRLGFESHNLTVKTYTEFKQALDATLEWVPTTSLVEDLRVIKDASELSIIKEAVRIADEAMLHVMGWLKPGVAEIEIAWEVESFIRTHGAEALSFSPITAIGENGAMAHAIPSQRKLQVGDSLVIDIGAQYEGYCSDITRSFCFGSASEKYLQAWNLVLLAQQTAEAGIRGGMTGFDGDALARKVIVDAGYGDKFGHGLGHGVGLEIHEGPTVSRLASAVMPAMSVVTIEPGIYETGWGGVRIEDTVFLTETGCTILTQSPKVPVI
ncbi:MAG: M24 family metallopeptidase [Anaerolineae bacterium]